jgi:hypothetical protein
MIDKFDDMKKLLLEAGDTNLDASMKSLIKKWSDPPRAIQVLEVIDRCIFSALASGLCLTLLQVAYSELLVLEGTTHEEIEKGATWRNMM